MTRKKGTAYCVKCKDHVKMEDVKRIRMGNQREADQGKCEICGGKVFSFEVTE